MSPQLLPHRMHIRPRRLWPWPLITVMVVGAAMWVTRGQGSCGQVTPIRQVRPLDPDPQAAALQQSFGRVAEMIKPAVVSITTVHTESVDVSPFLFDPFQEFLERFQGKPEEAPKPRQFQHRFEGLGSGVIIDPRGYILTNEHVVSDADDIKVTVKDPEERVYKGKVLGKDPSSDLAVVKIDPKQDLASLSMGDSSKVGVGDWAIAIGSPFGLEQTVTVGVISAVRQSFRVGERLYSDFLQTDAAINRGNSGGPLVNIRGEIIGINTAIVGPAGTFAGIGFAIPSSHAKYIMDQLIAKGRVVRGWIGVEILPLDEVSARQFGVQNGKGALINLVVPGSPADKAGMRRGDVILDFGGQKVGSPEDLIEAVTRTQPKTRVAIRVVRDGKPRELSLLTAEKPADAQVSSLAPGEEGPQTPSEGWEGAGLRAANPVLNRRAGLPEDSTGVMVVSVAPGSPAQELGLEPGDLIVSLNRAPTPDLRAFRDAVKKADLKQGILLDVNRRGRQVYLSFRKES